MKINLKGNVCLSPSWWESCPPSIIACWSFVVLHEEWIRKLETAPRPCNEPRNPSHHFVYDASLSWHCLSCSWNQCLTFYLLLMPAFYFALKIIHVLFKTHLLATVLLLPCLLASISPWLLVLTPVQCSASLQAPDELWGSPVPTPVSVPVQGCFFRWPPAPHLHFCCLAGPGANLHNPSLTAASSCLPFPGLGAVLLPPGPHSTQNVGFIAWQAGGCFFSAMSSWPMTKLYVDILIEGKIQWSNIRIGFLFITLFINLTMYF